jgi:hypothetical protein
MQRGSGTNDRGEQRAVASGGQTGGLETTAISVDESALRRFVGDDVAQNGCLFYLPEFCGNALLNSSGAVPPLQYSGRTFSERDARAAFYVSAMLSYVVDPDRIHLEATVTFEPARGLSQSAFLFGSRSNAVTLWALRTRAPRKFFDFAFGPFWQILCADGRVFSIPDPSINSATAYAAHTDYGIIEKFHDSIAGVDVFVIAGLGSRATEGCGYYLAHYWRALYQRFGTDGFGVVLEFPPPVEPKLSKPVVWLGS